MMEVTKSFFDSKQAGFTRTMTWNILLFLRQKARSTTERAYGAVEKKKSLPLSFTVTVLISL